MIKAFFVTGTDTDVGKTWASLALMDYWRSAGRRVAAMKPVAAGCVLQDGKWQNRDALLLQAAASESWPYEMINPYAFARAESPHKACDGCAVDHAVLARQLAGLGARSDYVLMEGAGGWFSPVDAGQFNRDLVLALNLPVILVVGMRLGCINHALLTLQAVQISGACCVGWLAVQLQPDMPAFAESLDYLQQTMDAPLLGVLSFMAEPEAKKLKENFHVKNQALLM
jgi:dethiobiotin synthetase